MRIVASLTTIPSRIWHIEPVLNSLLAQTRPFDAIYLNIPHKTRKNEEYSIPSFINQQKIIINRCEDYGPITKLLPTLDREQNADTFIVTFDDDRVISKNTLQTIIHYITQFPDTVLSFSGWRIGSFPFYLEWHDNRLSSEEVDWVQGCHSITYPRKFLNKEEILSFMPEMIRHDDHRMSAYLAMKKIRKIAIGENANLFFTPIPCCKTNAISGGDSIAGKIKYFCEVMQIAFDMKNKGIYTLPTKHIEETTGFYVVVGIVATMIIIFSFT